MDCSSFAGPGGLRRGLIEYLVERVKAALEDGSAFRLAVVGAQAEAFLAELASALGRAGVRTCVNAYSHSCAFHVLRSRAPRRLKHAAWADREVPQDDYGVMLMSRSELKYDCLREPEEDCDAVALFIRPKKFERQPIRYCVKLAARGLAESHSCADELAQAIYRVTGASTAGEALLKLLASPHVHLSTPRDRARLEKIRTRALQLAERLGPEAAAEVAKLLDAGKAIVAVKARSPFVPGVPSRFACRESSPYKQGGEPFRAYHFGLDEVIEALLLHDVRPSAQAPENAPSFAAGQKLENFEHSIQPN